MAIMRTFESNSDKLNRLNNEQLDRCDELDKKLNQMDLKYNNRKPASDGLIKGDEKDVDAILDMMAGIREGRIEINGQKKKMGISTAETQGEKILNATLDEHLL